MSFERSFRLVSAAISVAAVFALAGCGNKKPPVPPPQIIPAQTFDLRAQQRGEELILSFTYPTTTVGGLPLGSIAGVEFWEVVREVPLGRAPLPGVLGAEEAGADDGAGEEAEGQEEAAEEASEAALPGEAGEDEPSGDDQPAADDVDPEPELPERLEDLAVMDLLEFSASATVRATFTGAELESSIQGEKVIARFPLGRRPPTEALEAHHFAVKVISATGLGSGFSNIASIVRRETPDPPTDFVIEPDSSGVELSWFFAGEGPPEPAAAPSEADEVEVEVEVEEIDEPEAEVEGFHVYRRGARERGYGSPLARLAGSQRLYVDRSARLGEAYIYAVAAVVESDPLVESALSAEREIDYTDRFAPPPPRNLLTLAERGSVRVLWDASAADDVDGYFLFRAVGGGEFEALNEEPIRELEYTDRDVVSGAVYRYRIVAVDQVGNESVESEVSEARVP